jgi:hypothetical protein
MLHPVTTNIAVTALLVLTGLNVSVNAFAMDTTVPTLSRSALWFQLRICAECGSERAGWEHRQWHGQLQPVTDEWAFGGFLATAFKPITLALWRFLDVFHWLVGQHCCHQQPPHVQPMPLWAISLQLASLSQTTLALRSILLMRQHW